MTAWVRFDKGGEAGFGTLIGEAIAVFEGDMFGIATPTGETLTLANINLLTPCVPSKIVALWNNSKSAAEKQGLEKPADPLFFLKGPNTYLAPGGTIRKPASYDGRVIYEAELGIVIGKACKDADDATAAGSIFGYTCVNDVTAMQVLDSDPTFAQWARAKGYDTFGPFGPVIATEIDPASATIRAELNGRERQNYPVSDLFLQPAELVSRLSQFMTLEAGDIVSCGTGPGALPMKPGATIEVTIDGIGTLSNTYED
ncbi:MAG: 2-keto-4-pentenoate hydratase/2-oxohepta-3-ene-1,7-dioic acid hydratase in catechol pathway [Paracoccaceae bacterium]|jgi:2-keto-4-pentenoate hydratase/2-oxohepta-3-ene-1,7-dioic acid hydratase in catechol pathway